MFAVYKIYNHPKNVILTFYYSCLLFAIITAILLGLGLRKLRDEFKVNMLVLFITVGISVYGFETFLEFFSDKIAYAFFKYIADLRRRCGDYKAMWDWHHRSVAQ